MVVKKGYKQTEIGLIPMDWEVKKIGEVLKVIGGGAFKSIDNSRIGIKWLKIANVGINQAVWNEENYLPLDLVKENQNFLLHEGDYVIALTRPILDKKLKITKLTKNDVPALLNQRVGKIEVEKDNDNDFAYFLFQKSGTINALLQSMAGTDPPNLSNKGIYNIDCALPPTIAEQTAIATALSDTDGLITGLEKLIAKKRNIKQGAMQQLLQPKDGWEVKKLGEIALFYKGKGLPKSHINDNGKFKCIHYGELFTKHKEYIREVISYTNETLNLFYSITNDVLMPTSDVTPNGLATASCIKENGVILGGDVLVIRISEKILDGIFLSYFVTKNREQVMKLVSGSTVYHLSGSDMKNLTVYFPLIEEQNRIVSILTEMDAELSALEQKLEKYKKIKLGMMQELLTGKTRLV